MKTQVYSWRMSRELKSDLERAARLRNLRLVSVLEQAAREWLAKNAQDVESDEEQQRLHAAAARCIGTINGRNPRRAETASQSIKKSLRRRYGR